MMEELKAMLREEANHMRQSAISESIALANQEIELRESKHQEEMKELKGELEAMRKLMKTIQVHSDVIHKAEIEEKDTKLAEQEEQIGLMTSQIEVLQHQTTALNVGGYGVRSKAPDIFVDESGTIATRINEDGS